MSRHFQATCSACGHEQRVYRVELDRAARPRCIRCGGTLELSANAERELHCARSARKGEDSKRRHKEEPVQRVIPVRETKRYDFHEFIDVWRILSKMDNDVGRFAKERGPLDFYKGTLEVARSNPNPTDTELLSEILHMAEYEWYKSGKPYYKVWPSIAEALCHTEMRVDGENFRLPFRAFEVRFPKEDNPLSPATGVIVARIDNSRRNWTDGREWSFIIGFHTGEFQYVVESTTWVADIPIRAGLSLEDALDNTSLQRDCPDPGLARRMMRVCVGIAFFGIDNHEIILPEIPRKVIERFHRTHPVGATPSKTEAEEMLRQARDAGLFGWKVGSEILLPTSVVQHRDRNDPAGEHRELTCGHIRRGHMALVPCGEGKKDKRLVFRAPTVVRPDLPLQSQHGYQVRLT